MASNSQAKTFQQKYRVFSAAFWAQNGSPFDLEKSDKIVLPPSALNALTNCNATFPVLLKIHSMDKSSNKTLPSNTFSYVLDFAAPEGIVYMSSWLIERLNLDLSGQSVVELTLPTSNNLKYQCPTADFVQLQPQNGNLLTIPNAAKVISTALSEYYSSLRVGDVLTVYCNENGAINTIERSYKLIVMKVSGKETSYTPKCVRINNKETVMVGFTDPVGNVVEVPESKDVDDQKQAVQDQKEDFELDSDAEWEIVSVEKVKSLTDLEWKPPAQVEVEQEKPDQKEDIEDPPEIVDVEPVQEPVVEQKEDPVLEPEEAAAALSEWVCPQCATTNELQFAFCPKCGCKQPDKSVKEKSVSPKVQNAESQNEDQLFIEKVAIINDGVYRPLEQRQTGWIIKNVSGKELKMKTKLDRCGGDSDVSLEYEEVIHLEMKADDEMFIMMEVTAPSLVNQYHVFFQLLLINDVDTTQRICDVLRLPVKVEGQFDEEKEGKIKKLHQMGFQDRAKTITALKKWKWDELKAINWLATH